VNGFPCAYKIAWPTEALADGHRLYVEARNPRLVGVMRVYQCQYCELWHTGKWNRHLAEEITQ
jgi:hypothetical protein